MRIYSNVLLGIPLFHKFRVHGAEIVLSDNRPSISTIWAIIARCPVRNSCLPLMTVLALPPDLCFRPPIYLMWQDRIPISIPFTTKLRALEAYLSLYNTGSPFQQLS